MSNASSGYQLRSRISAAGELELSLVEIETPQPGAAEVVVRIEAAPINPSDIGLLFGAADMSTARASGTAARPVITARVPPPHMKAMAGRLDQSLPVGNEGAGVVVAAGASAAAQALLGKTVAVLGGAMYSQYRCLPVDQCLLLPPGTTPAEGASCFVNPLTALGMVETMRREGHTALVHTAAASNLGQMLQRLCLKNGTKLVNIVRNAQQQELLRAIGATWVCNSGSPTFVEDLTQALTETAATIAFDAVGGGRLAGQILNCMEAALIRNAVESGRYGTAVHKQVYFYGSLDTGPTEFTRGFGMSWSMGGWLLFQFLQRIGKVKAQQFKQRIAAELTTTFASHYTREVSLAGALQPEAIAEYGRRSTGAKFLINPGRDQPARRD
jgi:NADPH2:quinone reductase